MRLEHTLHDIALDAMSSYSSAALALLLLGVAALALLLLVCFCQWISVFGSKLSVNFIRHVVFIL